MTKPSKNAGGATGESGQESGSRSGAPITDVILDVERILSHQIAHLLNNSLGAIGVLSDMVAEDITDPDVQKRLSKVTLAAEMARAQVTALRYAVPRPDQVTPAVPFSFVRETMMLLLGDLGARLEVRVDPAAAVAALVGERAAMVYALSTLSSHVLGATSGRVTLIAVMSQGALRDDAAPLMGNPVVGRALRVDITSIEDVAIGNLGVDDIFWDRMMTACGAAVCSAPRGFTLFWPV